MTHRLGVQRQAELIRPSHGPSLRPLGGEGVKPHGVRAAGQFLVLGVLSRSLDQDYDRLEAGPLQIAQELGSSLRLSFPAFHVTEHDDPSLRQHWQGVTEGVDLFRVELRGRSLIEVEVPQEPGSRVPSSNHADGFVLEQVLMPVQIVHRRH